MERPNKDQTALLQARHLYNDARIEKVIDGGGFTIGKDDVIIKVNRYAWGLFEKTILDSFKKNEFLRKWSPGLVSQDIECDKCKGAGDFPFTDEENVIKLAEWNEGLAEDDHFYCKPGTKFSTPCNPCQGTGIVLKPQPKAE